MYGGGIELYTRNNLTIVETTFSSDPLLLYFLKCSLQPLDNGKRIGNKASSGGGIGVSHRNSLTLINTTLSGAFLAFELLEYLLQKLDDGNV